MSRCILNSLKIYENYLEDLISKDGILSTKLYYFLFRFLILRSFLSNRISNFKSFYGSFTLDVISSCCFGMDINSISDPNNEFLKNLQIIFNEGFNLNLKFIIICKFENLLNN